MPKDDSLRNQKLTENSEQAVLDRYAKGAEAREAALCCPVDYDRQYLEILPTEILERDYGCGDPSRYLKEGETVLDLGSGGGKICYIASQIVGAKGRVLGVDFNPAMLSLARKYKKEMAARIGWANVDFLTGKIQDLATNLDQAEKWMQKNPIDSLERYQAFLAEMERQRSIQPLVADESIDVVISNCVLNLVKKEDRKQLFKEIHRVLKRGGRVAISDIVSDEEVPVELQEDAELWSGCISGSFQEKEFVEAFEEAGFYGISIDKRDENPWQTVKGIEFRSVTIIAFKGKEGPCLERNQAVVYKGPWKAVMDDDDHIYYRGARMAVCDKTLNILSRAPYGEDLYKIHPVDEISLDEAGEFACKKSEERHPRITKGLDYDVTTEADDCCSSGECC